MPAEEAVAHPYVWADATSAPAPADAADGLAATLERACDGSDAALAAAAARLSDALAEGEEPPDTAELTFALRAAGAPHVWPRVWTLAGGHVEEKDAQQRVQHWLAGMPKTGRRLCGAAVSHGASGEAVALMISDSLAELSPLPTRARTGQWLSVQSRITVPASAAKIVLLGPSGAPKPIPTSFHDGVVKGSFTPDHAGGWLVQVLADTDKGPRPVAEAMVFADVSPPKGFHLRPAPGESAGAGAKNDADALAAMINAARRGEHVGALRRDARLDAAAQAHADAMAKAGMLAHDVGQGGAKERIDAAGLSPRSFGENIARATSLPRAHRTIWASPSHRQNVLEARYDSVGIGIVRSPGVVWACEIFADFR